MAPKFRTYQPDQLLLLPPDLRSWLPQGHLCYFISDTVDALELGSLLDGFNEEGRVEQPYHPKMMLKLLLYGYCTGVFSSRGIARKIEEDIAFRVLASGNEPNHRTICRFRERHLEVFSDLFKQVVEIGKEAKLVKLGIVAIDGTKVKAGAHINGVGAFTPEMLELPEEAIRIAKPLVVDTIHGALHEAGDVIGAIKNGAVQESSLIELGTIILGQAKGRVSNEDITLFKTVGSGVLDVVTARRIYEKALVDGVGQELEF